MPPFEQKPASFEVIDGTPTPNLPPAVTVRNKGRNLGQLVLKQYDNFAALNVDLATLMRDGESIAGVRAYAEGDNGMPLSSLVYSRWAVGVTLGQSTDNCQYIVHMGILTTIGRVFQVAVIVKSINEQFITNIIFNSLSRPPLVLAKPANIFAQDVVFDPDDGTDPIIPPTERAEISVSTAQLYFPVTPVGEESETMVVSIGSVGTAVLELRSLVVTGEYKIHGGYPPTLMPGFSASVRLTLNPESLGDKPGKLTISTNALNSPAVIELIGQAQEVGKAEILVSPQSHDFGSIEEGKVSPYRSFTISNAGDGVLRISSMTVAGDFVLAGQPAVVAPGGTATFSVAFRALSPGDRTGSVEILSNASPVSIPLTAKSTAKPVTPARLTFAPTTIEFGSIAAGRTVTQNVRITNTGGQAATLSGFRLDPDRPSMTISGQPTSLAGGASALVAIQFAPTENGSYNTALKFESSTAESPHSLPVKAAASDTPNRITWIHADGAKLIDEDGEQVMLRSINWFGFEQIFLPQGLWGNPYKTITVEGVVHEGLIDKARRYGFNSLRLTISQDVTWFGTKPVTDGSDWNVTYVDPTYNPDLFLPSENPWAKPQPVIDCIQIMDKIIAYAKSLGMRVILDLHTLAPDNDNFAGTHGKWYTTALPGDVGATDGVRGEPRSEQQAIDALVFLAKRYKDEPAVCGIDLINEPHECTWDDDPLTGVHGYYERVGAAIQAVNPRIMLICEGIMGNVQFGTEGDPSTLWGTVWSGKLDVARALPVVMPVANRVIYSPHEYGSYLGGYDGIAHQWFEQPTYPENMFEVWRRQWGYLAQENIAPVWIGEIGSWFKAGTTPKYTQQFEDLDAKWIKKLGEYCDLYHIGFAYWALNPDGEPDGLLIKDGMTWGEAYPYKLAALRPLLFPGSVDETFFLTDESGVLLTDETDVQITTEDQKE